MKKKKAQKALDNVLEPTQGMSTNEITEYLSLVMSVSVMAMRGIAGDEYVDDFLTAALNDKSKPKIEKMNIQ